MFSLSRSICSNSTRQYTRINQTIRRYATEQQQQPTTKSNSRVFQFSALGAVVGGAAYFYFSRQDKFVAEKAVELKPAEPTFKGDNEWIPLKLIDIQTVTHDSKRFRFALPSEDHVTGLKIASALLTRYQPPGSDKPVIRPYTPISDEDERGYLDLLVKRYPGGLMTEHLHSMNIDQQLNFKGPIPKYTWSPNKHEHVALIAGGTGITPMYQLIRAIFKNSEDKTKITLIYGNKTEDDILLKKELQSLENTYPNRFKAFYFLDAPPAGSNWATRGHITKELLKTVLPEPGKGNNKIFVCGPPGMYQAISGGKKSPSDQGELNGYLKELGYSKDEVYKF